MITRQQEGLMHHRRGWLMEGLPGKVVAFLFIAGFVAACSEDRPQITDATVSEKRMGIMTGCNGNGKPWAGEGEVFGNVAGWNAGACTVKNKTMSVGATTAMLWGCADGSATVTVYKDATLAVVEQTIFVDVGIQ